MFCALVYKKRARKQGKGKRCKYVILVLTSYVENDWATEAAGETNGPETRAWPHAHFRVDPDLRGTDAGNSQRLGSLPELPWYGQ